MVRRRDLYYELITLQKKLANTLVDGNHKQGLILRIKELTKKIELETQNIYLDVKEIDLIEFRQQIINKYPDLRDIFHLFWFTFSPFLDIDETLSYNGFERFNKLLFFALVGNKNDMDARSISKLDYDYYIKIYNKIDKIAFFDILFKILVDWTDKDDILYYCCFMWSLLDIIADLKWTPPRLRPKREIKNLLKTETDVTMFGRYFESKNIREISLQRFESWKTLDSKAKSRVASRRVGSNLDESQVKAIADIFYSKTCLTADDNENTDSDADLDDDQGEENINVRDENINAHTKHTRKQKSPVTTEKSHEDEFYERLRNVKGKVNSWNNRAFDLYRWDPDDNDMLDSIYNDRGFAIKKLKYFESDDFIDDQMEEANVHAINVIKKFDNSFKARETMYEKKHVVREREVREKVIVPSRPKLNSKPRITPIMLQAKQIVKERGIGAFMQATKVTAAKESKKSWQTLAKIMENRNKRRLKRETMMMTTYDSKPFVPSSSLLDEIEEEDDDEFEELEELLHQLKEEAKIENTIKSLSAEELFQLEFEENEKISVDAIDLSAEESIPALVDTYLNELNEGNRPDDMTDGFSEADEFILTDSFSPSHVLKSKNSHKKKELSQSAFLVLKSSVPPETRLKMKDELDNRKKIRKGKDPLFPRSFITSSGEFLTAGNIQWRSNMEKETMTSNNEARKALNSAMKKSKYDIKAQTVNDVRHIKDEIEATKKNQFMKDEKRFDQIRSFKHFRHQMISYLKESKNPHTTDCMRYMNEKMVSIILNTYNNVDPKVLIRELFETIEQNNKFINESSNNSKERDIISHGLSSNTYTLRNEDLNFLNEDQQVENWDRTDDYREFDLSKFESENCSQLENIETISTKELLVGKFSPLAAVRNIHPEQHGNRKNWNESSPGWQTFGSGFRSQSPTSIQISNSHNHQSHFPSTKISSSDDIIEEYHNLDLRESDMSGELKSNNSYHDNDDNDIYDNALNKNLFTADIDNNNNDDDKSIDDSIDGERKNTIFVKLDSPREEAPSQRFVKTPELHLSREVTPASNKKIISNDMIKKKLLHESIPQENPSFYFEGEGSKTDVMSVNTTNMIINQNKNSMKLQPITPPALFSVDSFSIGISPQLFDTKLFEKSRLVRSNNNQASAIRIRKSTKYNELKLFPSKSVGNISNSVDVVSISKDKIIEKLNELKLKEATNCLYSTKSQTIEGRYRSGKSITPKRELLNKLHGRGVKVLRPFCGM